MSVAMSLPIESIAVAHIQASRQDGTILSPQTHPAEPPALPHIGLVSDSRTCILSSAFESAQEGFVMSGHSIHIKLDGRTYSGSFKVDRQVLTVTTNYGKKSAEVSKGTAHEALATQLLEKLVREEKGRKGSTL